MNQLWVLSYFLYVVDGGHSKCILFPMRNLLAKRADGFHSSIRFLGMNAVCIGFEVAALRKTTHDNTLRSKTTHEKARIVL